jgi:hypothetical protein
MGSILLGRLRTNTSYVHVHSERQDKYASDTSGRRHGSRHKENLTADNHQTKWPSLAISNAVIGLLQLCTLRYGCCIG